MNEFKPKLFSVMKNYSGSQLVKDIVAGIIVAIIATLILYQLTMFLILVCKVPDMLATCALLPIAL